jgi:glycosyltransferase involved in cell wall biosynthesis
VAVKEITDRLPEFEFELVTVNLDGKQEPVERVGNCTVYRLGDGPKAKYAFPRLAYRWAIERHETEPFQLTWAIMANQAAMAAAWFKKACPTIPYLLTLQEGDEVASLAYRVRLLGPKLAGVFRRADAAQAISYFLADWGKRMGVAGPITVVPNGVDLEKFTGRPSIPTARPDGATMLITTSRLVKKNGLADLISSLAFLPPTITLKIYGTGPEETTLRQLAVKLGVNSRVTFAGQAHHAELARALAAADVFVRPSLSEGLGNSFLEALAVGLPVVGTPVGGIPDFLHADETGWLCRVNDPASIADQIKDIINPANQEKVARIIKQAQELVRNNYSWEKVAGEMKNVFNKLI